MTTLGIPILLFVKIIVESLFKSNDLAGIFVWIPMIDSDSQERAISEANSCTDSRVTQYWDADKTVGDAYRRLFGLTKTVWDMYLVYGPGVDWKGDQPPSPTFYMHQMNTRDGTDPVKVLVPEVFHENVETILSKAEDSSSN